MKYLPVFAEWLAWSGRLLINHLWQATLFSVMALTATLLLKRAPARARYLIWLAAAAKFALPSALIFMLLSGVGIDLQSVFKSSSKAAPTLQYIGPIVSPIVVPKDYLAGVPDLTTAGKSEARAVDVPKSSGLSVLISLVWLTGCLILFYSWIKRRRQVTVAIRTGHRQVVGREREALTTVMAWLGVRRHVELVITPSVKEPGVWGTMRPTVLLPEEISAQLTDEELESLMMHEMAHVLRWDNLVSNLNMVLCCLFWFNPIVWL